MAFWGKKKSKTENCDCGGCCDANVTDIKKTQSLEDGGLIVKILGSGCKKCNELEANTRIALEELGMSAEIDHVFDFAQIATYGVMTTPALVVNEKVLSFGKVLSADEIVKLLQNN